MADLRKNGEMKGLCLWEPGAVPYFGRGSVENKT
jgi:hypothetical protein